MKYYNEFSTETQAIIFDIYDKQRRVRKSRISENEMRELLSFTKLLACRYEEISAVIEEARDEKKRRNGRDVKSSQSKHDAYHRKGYRKIDRIFSTNKYYASPQIKRDEEGKCKKRFNVHSIRKISEIFYTAHRIGESCTRRLLEVPDIHFVITTIKKDEFGDLLKYMGIAL